MPTLPVFFERLLPVYVGGKSIMKTARVLSASQTGAHLPRILSCDNVSTRGTAPMPRVTNLPVSKGEVVQVCGVCRLVVVSVHLVVNCNSPPVGGSFSWRVIAVYVVDLSVQRDRLEQ